jgi:prevent-host-death family protein
MRCFMKTLESSQLRSGMAKALDSVAHSGERIAISRRGKRVAALVSVEDLALLEALEDQVDRSLAKTALSERGSIPLANVKKALKLK